MTYHFVMETVTKLVTETVTKLLCTQHTSFISLLDLLLLDLLLLRPYA